MSIIKKMIGKESDCMLTINRYFCTAILFCSIFNMPTALAAPASDSVKIKVSITIPPKMSASLNSNSAQKDSSLCVMANGLRQYRLHAAGQGKIIKNEDEEIYTIEQSGEQDTGLVTASYTERQETPVDCLSQTGKPTAKFFGTPHIVNNTDKTVGLMISAE